MESELVTPVDSIKDVVRSSVKVRQTPEEGRRTYRPKRCGNNTEDKDTSPKTLNDKKPHICFYRDYKTDKPTNKT